MRRLCATRFGPPILLLFPGAGDPGRRVCRISARTAGTTVQPTRLETGMKGADQWRLWARGGPLHRGYRGPRGCRLRDRKNHRGADARDPNRDPAGPIASGSRHVPSGEPALARISAAIPGPSSRRRPLRPPRPKGRPNRAPRASHLWSWPGRPPAGAALLRLVLPLAPVAAGRKSNGAQASALYPAMP